MDIVSVLRSCGRRWWVFVLVAGGIVGFGVVQYRAAVPSYTQSEQLLVIVGGQPDVENPTINPLGDVNAARAVLAARMNTEDFIGSVAAPSVSLVTEVAQNGPILVVTAVGDRPAEVTAALTRATQAASSTLAQVQTAVGAPSSVAYRVSTLSVDPAPSVSFPSRVKALLATCLAAILLATIAAVLVDFAFRRRPGARTTRRTTVAERQDRAEPGTRRHRRATTPAVDSGVLILQPAPEGDEASQRSPAVESSTVVDASHDSDEGLTPGVTSQRRASSGVTTASVRESTHAIEPRRGHRRAGTRIADGQYRRSKP